VSEDAIFRVCRDAAHAAAPLAAFAAAVLDADVYAARVKIMSRRHAAAKSLRVHSAPLRHCRR